jgi:LytR cell envelope-related transcriptional attenuator
VLALASPSPQPAASSPPTQPPQTTPVTPQPRGSLAVLNGTKVTGLARGVADQLTTLGYDEPDVVANDVTNQSRARTTIYFEPGHRTDALGVASCLHIGRDRVVPMVARARALADRARVAIFVGYDRAP